MVILGRQVFNYEPARLREGAAVWSPTGYRSTARVLDLANALVAEGEFGAIEVKTTKDYASGAKLIDDLSSELRQKITRLSGEIVGFEMEGARSAPGGLGAGADGALRRRCREEGVSDFGDGQAAGRQGSQATARDPERGAGGAEVARSLLTTVPARPGPPHESETSMTPKEAAIEAILKSALERCAVNLGLLLEDAFKMHLFDTCWQGDTNCALAATTGDSTASFVGTQERASRGPRSTARRVMVAMETSPSPTSGLTMELKVFGEIGSKDYPDKSGCEKDLNRVVSGGADAALFVVADSVYGALRRDTDSYQLKGAYPAADTIGFDICGTLWSFLEGHAVDCSRRKGVDQPERRRRRWAPGGVPSEGIGSRAVPTPRCTRRCAQPRSARQGAPRVNARPFGGRAQAQGGSCGRHRWRRARRSSALAPFLGAREAGWGGGGVRRGKRGRSTPRPRATRRA